METRIYLIRHGQTAWNKELRCQGHTDVPLDEAGRRQARELAERLRTLPLQAVYSSDLQRARETAELLAAPHGLNVVTTPFLRERNMGRWTGLTWTDRERGWPELCVRWDHGDRDMPEDLAMEPYGALTERLVAAIREVAEKRPGADVAIVTHGGFIAALLDYLGIPVAGRRPFLQNCAVTPLVVGGAQGWWIDQETARPEASA